MSFLRLLVASLGAVVGTIAVLPLVVATIPFWLIGGLTRLISRGLERRPQAWQELIVYEPKVGWRARAGLDTYALADEPFHLTTGADGWRGRRTFEDADILVFGDSFAFGYGADDERMYSEQENDLRIKPIGINGYNMVQSLLWMERYAPRLGGKIVVWLVYYGNDLYENLCPNLAQYRMPFVRQSRTSDDWEIVTEHVSEEPWRIGAKREYLARLAEICAGGYLSSRAFSACEFLIRRAKAICEGAGARLVVVGAPDSSQLGGAARLVRVSPAGVRIDPELPDRRLSEICQRLEVGFVSLTREFGLEDFKAGDVHWTPGGHRRFAAVLKRIAREQPVARAGRRWLQSEIAPV